MDLHAKLGRFVDSAAHIPLELELPSGEHRERLLLALANLVRRRGYEPLVAAPIVLPRSEFFPDQWEPTLAGARRLLRRLMLYADLGQLRVRLRGYREKPLATGNLAPRHEQGHTAAWFAGIEDQVCDFGLELDGLRHEASLVATLAHEVAHAYREQHGLVISDYDLEEKLTDLTSVYLGFGVFTLGASRAFETGGYDASGQRLLYEVRSLGYLSPAELALLLAAQLALRDDRAEQRAVLSELSPNHAALFQRGVRELAADLDGLRALLGVPRRAEWPLRDERPLLPLPEEEDDGVEVDQESADEAARSPAEAGDEIAFRVQHTRSASLALLGAGASAAATLIAGAGGWTFYASSALGALLGHWFGRRLRRDECSSCGQRLPAEVERCERCAARIVGSIASRDERLEAEERYRALHAPLAPERRVGEHSDS